MKFAVTDIETSGFSGVANTITEISILIFDGEKIIDEFTSLVNPQCPIPPKITQLTGISADMLVDAPLFSEIGERVEEITRDCIFVAHSVNFDYPIIAKELKNLGIDFNRKKLCTVRYSREALPGHRSYSLGNVCRDLDIPINGRHRARGDAEATVELLKIALKKDADQSILKKHLKPKGREGNLPPNLAFETFDNLPDFPGVYRFIDEKKKVIYVGKAKNIKMRVSSHFSSKTTKSRNMKLEIHDIQYQATGTEFMALLQEAAAVKHYYPKYNSALKRSALFLGVAVYENQLGVRQLGISRVKPNRNPYPVFTNQSVAHRFLIDFVEEYGLCPKQAGIENNNNEHCLAYERESCMGICCNMEEVASYNQRLEEALKAIALPTEDHFIILEGRDHNEKGFVYLNNGVYAGYGYAPIDCPEEKLLDFLEQQENNADTQAIVQSYLLQLESSGEMMGVS